MSFVRSAAADGCITRKGEPGAILDGGGNRSVGVTIDSRAFVAVVGLTAKNYRGGDLPIGISVKGSANHLEIRNNVVTNIVSSSNAHGIAFYGTSPTPMSDLPIDGNEVTACKLGQSESMVLNGGGEVIVQYNASGVVVRNNVFFAKSGNAYVAATGSDDSGITVDANLYFGASTSSPEPGATPTRGSPTHAS